MVRIGIGIQISDPSDPSDSTEHFILDLDCCHVENGAHKAPKRVNVVLIACVVQKVNKLYLHPRVRTTMCTKMIFTRHIRTKVTFGSVGSGQPCSPRWVDRIQIRRIRIRIRPIERVRIQWIRWIGIPILPIEHALTELNLKDPRDLRSGSRSRSLPIEHALSLLGIVIFRLWRDLEFFSPLQKEKLKERRQRKRTSRIRTHNSMTMNLKQPLIPPSHCAADAELCCSYSLVPKIGNILCTL